jgi:hypothetical protein
VRRAFLVAAIVLALGAGTPAQATSSVAPSLRLVRLTPLTLRGSGFRVGERVRITVSFRRIRAARTVRADRRGRFTFRYTTLLALEPCRGTLVVTAVGTSSARRATYKRPCRPPDPIP